MRRNEGMKEELKKKKGNLEMLKGMIRGMQKRKDIGIMKNTVKKKKWEICHMRDTLELLYWIRSM
jgi:hypothetical protein